MRLGISGTLLPDNVTDMTPGIAATIRDWGYTGIFTRLRANRVSCPSDADCQTFRDILTEAGLEHVMATGYWQNLIHPDIDERERSLEILYGGLRLAARLGATCIDTGPGSMSPNGPWAPHPDNWSAWAEANLIDSLKRAADVAEEVGVRIHLEGHQLVTLRDADTTRRVIDAIGSSWVCVDIDPVNWITLDTYFDTRMAIDGMFDTLGDRIGSGHSKDVQLWDRHTIHLDTVVTGSGAIDHAHYIARLESLSSEIYLIVEACETSQASEVHRFLTDQASRAGVRVY